MYLGRGTSCTLYLVHVYLVSRTYLYVVYVCIRVCACREKRGEEKNEKKRTRANQPEKAHALYVCVCDACTRARRETRERTQEFLRGHNMRAPNSSFFFILPRTTLLYFSNSASLLPRASAAKPFARPEALYFTAFS